jgi:hypothetical protein
MSHAKEILFTDSISKKKYSLYSDVTRESGEGFKFLTKINFRISKETVLNFTCERLYFFCRKWQRGGERGREREKMPLK